MRIAAIGVGGAGGRVVDALWRDSEAREAAYLSGARAVDTDPAALDALESVPEEARHAFGQIEVDGAGTDGDPDRGAAALDADRTALRRDVDGAITSDADAVVLVAGLGGGTGAGATPGLVRALREVYERPIYAVSILPASGEDADRAAARGLAALDEVVDAQLVFDDDAWLDSGESVDGNEAALNDALVRRLGALFAAGEATVPEQIGERVVDASEVMQTLDGGGLATIGYARQQLREEPASDGGGLVGRVRDRLLGAEPEAVDDVAAIKAVETTLRRAARGQFTLECPLAAAERGLLVVAGPPEWLNRQALADGRSWLADEMGSVQLRTGDAPVRGGNHLSVLVLLSGVRDAPRVESLKAANR